MIIDAVPSEPEIVRVLKWGQLTPREKILANLEETYCRKWGRLTINGIDVSSSDVSKEAVAGMLIAMEEKHRKALERAESGRRPASCCGKGAPQVCPL